MKIYLAGKITGDENYREKFRKQEEEFKNQAMKLLTRTNLNIRRISELVGYESSTGFFIAFKKRFRVTPGEYRAAKKE